MNQEIGGQARASLKVQFLDLSLGGALTIVPAPLRFGEVHDFSMDLQGETLEVRGEVRRCVPRGGTDGFEVGIQFVALDSANETRLKRYLANRG